MDQGTSHHGSGVRKGLPKVRGSKRTRMDCFAGDLRYGKRRISNQASKEGDPAARSLARRQRRAMPPSLGGFDGVCNYCGIDIDSTESGVRYHPMCRKRKLKGIQPPYSSSSSSSSGSQSGPGQSGGSLSKSSEGKPVAIKPPRVPLSPRKWCGWNPGWLGGKSK